MSTNYKPIRLYRHWDGDIDEFYDRINSKEYKEDTSVKRDIDGERAHIFRVVMKMNIKDPEEEDDKIQECLDNIAYDRYIANNHHLVSEYELIELKDQISWEAFLIHIEDYIDEILKFSDMMEVEKEVAMNILVINENRKFTFLNFIHDIREIPEKARIKRKREYGDYDWDNNDNSIYKIVYCLRE